MTTVERTAGTEAPATHLQGWDCIEWWVGNARSTAGFLMSAFGFECSTMMICGPFLKSSARDAKLA